MWLSFRIPSEAEPLPQELKAPVAIADDLLDTTATSSTAPDASKAAVEDSAASEVGEELPSTASFFS